MAAMIQRDVGPVPPGLYVPMADERVILHGIGWSGYQTLLALRGERSRPRLAYLDGAVEIMTTSRDHERIKKYIGSLLEAYLYELDVPFCSYGSYTQQAPEEAGAEADDCYQLGTDQRERPPGVVIEVVWTRGGLNKLEIYRRLGVREVWFWIDGAITAQVLVDDRWETRERSACLPDVDLALIAEPIDAPLQSDAVKQLRATLAARR